MMSYFESPSDQGMAADIAAINTNLTTLTSRVDYQESDIASAVIYSIEDRDAGSTSGVTLVTNQIALSFFTARINLLATTMAVRVGATAAATITTIRYCLFQLESNLDLTLKACTANDTSLLIATNTTYPKAFAADGSFPGTGTSFQFVKGVRYAAGVLLTATTAPALAGGGTLRDASWSLDEPKISAFRSQTVLESTITNANQAAGTRRFQARFS